MLASSWTIAILSQSRESLSAVTGKEAPGTMVHGEFGSRLELTTCYLTLTSAL
jgi:hypothetical protein